MYYKLTSKKQGPERPSNSKKERPSRKTITSKTLEENNNIVSRACGAIALQCKSRRRKRQCDTHTDTKRHTHTYNQKLVNSIDQKLSNDRMLAQLNFKKRNFPSWKHSFVDPLVPFPMCGFDAEIARRTVLTGVGWGDPGKGIARNHHVRWPFFSCIK